MKVDLAHWIETLKSSNLFVLASVVLVLLSSVITIAKAVGLLVNWYKKTVGYKQSLIRKIRKLSADASIEHFRDVLGTPAFINHQRDFIEYIFALGKLGYVQALTDDNGRVLAYSVTTRSKKFNPTLSLGPYSLNSRRVTIVLGKSRFSDLDQLDTEPECVVCTVGAHDYYYSEKYYFGNPGHYQSYCFSLIQAGYVDQVCPMVEAKDLRVNHPAIQTFRQKGSINTFTITTPRWAEELNEAVFGPNYNQVRVAREL